ncbi:hypothetical protein D1F64_00200 [Breoghania sp. L-A4]|nr:hypothetical protein D1F64_00200 [Breoghania sp. L-A4]
MATSFVVAPALAGSSDLKVRPGAAAGAKAHGGMKLNGGGHKVGAGAKVGIGAKASGGRKAQGLDTAAGTKAGAKARGLDTAAGATSGLKMTGSAGGNANNQGEVVSSIRSNNKAAADISTITDASKVTVVRVDSATESSAKAIDNAVRDNQDAIGKLRSSIEANGEVANKLSAAGVRSDNVVAARTGADGSLTVYVR